MSAAPRLLLIGNGLGGGGAETRLRLLAQHMFAGAAEVAVVNGGHHPALDPRQAVHPLGWTGPRSAAAAARRLKAVIEAGGFDVVMSFGLYPNLLAWAAIRGLAARPRLVMTEITRPYTESRLGGPLRHGAYQALRKLAYPRADLFAANSIDGLEEVARHYGVPRDRLRRLPNIVEPDKLAATAAAPCAEAAAGPRFCAVARLDPLKRLDTLIEAAAGLPQDQAWGVDILGEGPDRARLGSLISGWDLQSRVRLQGWVEAPHAAMRASCAVVLTSTYEGFSNTVLEALTLGVPVVTSFCSADARHMVEAGAALGFSVGDAGVLRDHLGQLLASPTLRARLAAAGPAYAAPHMLPAALPAYERLARDAIALSPHKAAA